MQRGTGASVCRRWLAALLRLPERERERLVEAAERRAAADNATESPLLHVRGSRVQRDGYIEQIVRSYGASASRAARRRASG